MLSTIYLFIIWFFGIGYGFVLISSAASQHADINLFKTGESLLYQLHSTILMNEIVDNDRKNVGFYINGNLLIDTIWSDAYNNEKILRLELRSLNLHIRSRKAPSPDGFIQHRSKFDDTTPIPFYLLWQNGRILKLLMLEDEDWSMVNLKRGIASLFQFQLLDGEQNETDSSGYCSVNYQTIDSNKFQKIKTNCRLNRIDDGYNGVGSVFGVDLKSTRLVNYELDPGQEYLKSISNREKHQLYTVKFQNLGNYLQTDQVLTFVKTNTNRKIDVIDNYYYKTIDEAERKLYENQLNSPYKQFDLLLDYQSNNNNNDYDENLVNVINNLRDNLKSEKLGKLVSAKAFIKIIKTCKNSNKDDVLKALSSKKNQKILPQIYDILGNCQSDDVHKTVMKRLHFDKDDHLDASERYLWSLSLSPNPNIDVIVDLLNRHNHNDNYPEKVRETLILTIASMIQKLDKQQNHQTVRKVYKNVEEAIINGLDYTKNDERLVFIRALKNLQSPTTIPTLINLIKNGNNKETIYALKAIKSFDQQYWKTNEVLQIMQRIFLQLDRKYDSSARTLAIDILLEINLNNEQITEFLDYLKSNDSNYEIKQYLVQNLQMISDENRIVSNQITAILKQRPDLNNYSVLSPRGLSTALKRNVYKSPTINSSLLTIQEMNNGIVKRGIVNIIANNQELINLGIFAGGLGGLIGGDSDDDDDQSATAGMELTVLGTQIRPFVFFTGQGELMGHVWSGTASERTTAYQSLILLDDYSKSLHLSSGFIVEIDQKSAISFDLSGKIEISIWGRTADSVVEKSVGILTIGSMVLDSSFVRSQVEYFASIEPKLNIKSDIDFSSNMNLCMRVTQPDAIFKHNIFKIERIPGSKHKLRIAKYKKTPIPGTTYSLNKKNNEMCNVMFKS